MYHSWFGCSTIWTNTILFYPSTTACTIEVLQLRVSKVILDQPYCRQWQWSWEDSLEGKRSRSPLRVLYKKLVFPDNNGANCLFTKQRKSLLRVSRCGKAKTVWEWLFWTVSWLNLMVQLHSIEVTSVVATKTVLFYVQVWQIVYWVYVHRPYEAQDSTANSCSCTCIW